MPRRHEPSDQLWATHMTPQSRQVASDVSAGIKSERENGRGVFTDAIRASINVAIKIMLVR